LSEEEEIMRDLQRYIQEIKKDIKMADTNKTGSIKEDMFIKMM